jgi:hypothetical protein
VVRQYVPGDGWSRSVLAQGTTLQTPLGGPAPERLQGVAQAPDPPG